MARQTNNRLVQTLDGGGHKQTTTNAPAVETENARFEQVGPFRRANVAINLAAVALTLGGVDADAPTSMLMGRAGAICGIAYSFNAAISAGGATAAQIQAAVGPAGAALVAQGNLFSVASGGAQRAVLDETAGSVKKGTGIGEVPFSEGDAIGVLLTSNGTFAPTTADLDVYLLVRWTAT